jgi:predicted enzyme related to lactoylglutathione lyase
MIVNPSAPPGPVVPVLAYRDVAQAIPWLCAAFGFTERLRTPPAPDGSIHHAQLAAGEGAVILTTSAAPPRSFLLVKVKDADRHHETARQSGAHIVRAPKTAEFGERQYTAEDLAGHQWTFSQSVSAVNPADWGAQVARLIPMEALLPRPRFCYFEIPAVDVHKSADFYEKVFAWNIRHRESARPSFDAPAGISGAWVTGRPAHRDPGFLPYIWVDEMDAVLARISAAGGEVVAARHLDSPGGEWIATFRDPAGNLIGLYQEGGYLTLQKPQPAPGVSPQ